MAVWTFADFDFFVDFIWNGTQCEKWRILLFSDFMWNHFMWILKPEKLPYWHWRVYEFFFVQNSQDVVSRKIVSDRKIL